MRRDRPGPMMPHGPRPVHGGAFGITRDFSANGSDSLVSFVNSEDLKRVPHWDSVGKSIALRLVQKQLIIYLRKVSVTGLCNQQVTGGLEARFLDHESCSLCTGLDDQRPAGPGDAAARAACVLHPARLGNLQ